MKVSFFHDHPFVVSKNVYYTHGGLMRALWKRYLECFQEIIVATRRREVESIVDKKLAVANCEHVFFEPVYYYNQGSNLIFKYDKIKNQIKTVLEKTDCAIIRLPSIIGLIACHEAIKMKKPWAVEVVGCTWDTYWNHGTIAGKIVAPVMYLLNRHYIKKASHAIYVSEQFLQERYPAQGIQAGCSDVVLAEVSPDVLKARLDKIEQGFNNRPIKFGLVGSLNIAYKGHETAIKALAAVKTKIPPFKLRFLGGGSGEKWQALAAKCGIADNVEFCGTLPSGEPVLNWMDDTDIYLIPSLQEGLPRALVEAMSRGCPALGARTGGIPELLPEECIHNRKDWEKLGKDIIRLVNDPDKLKQYATENFNTAKKYTNNLLDKRRSSFWMDFRQYVQQYGN
ncbi:MAG TPA: glycosyltransferase family 4 protein [Methylomusa anaerophila]|uniref:D-inositol 3-phosphate glycosyltransferase n=1 Tax=Methylomusa anaerophila TaxID=1930071 RepID=A0A348AGC3_9FIRM|nr:glycosyltransferase family 4 protein [Methylomusa anaerophila]BBB90121.1 D-inositol 3-phosphate glycosyltransferase [Methylomusa anaerophila]HML88155.1 glycosyltransferase family 4 protein [Methylomusa anaerophila]